MPYYSLILLSSHMLTNISFRFHFKIEVDTDKKYKINFSCEKKCLPNSEMPIQISQISLTTKNRRKSKKTVKNRKKLRLIGCRRLKWRAHISYAQRTPFFTPEHDNTASEVPQTRSVLLRKICVCGV